MVATGPGQVKFRTLASPTLASPNRSPAIPGAGPVAKALARLLGRSRTRAAGTEEAALVGR